MCGRQLATKCPHCNNMIGLEDLFCVQCGARRNQVAEPGQVSVVSSNPKSYTPRHLAEKILKGRSKIQGEKKNVSVLFADVVGYTSIAERLGPEKSHATIAGCFDILTRCVHHFEGTINQYTGDGIMALFGAPIAHEDHVFRALESALLMRNEIKRYAVKLKEEKKIDFAMRLGINTGLVVVGSIGDDLRLDYTAVGDTTNQAARLEQMAKSGQILVSEHTERVVRGFFNFRPLGKVALKGKTTSVNIFELLGQGRIKTKLQAQELRGLTPFQGRKKALSLLEFLSESARQGTGRTISITGQAGIGKSRLVIEALRPLTNVFRFECSCAQFAQNIPYYPFIELFKETKTPLVKDNIVGFVDKSGSSGQSALNEKISHLMTECRRLLVPKELDRPSRPDLSPEIKGLISETMKKFFLAHSQIKPVFFIVEDMHWIDRYSEDFLHLFVDSMRQQSVLMVTVHRPEYQPPWEDRSHYDRLNLASLAEPESRCLVDSLIGDLSIPEESCNKIVQQANGNPFFIEELTRMVIEKTETIPSFDISNLDIPDSIQDLLAARIDQLHYREKQIIQAAAVLGQEFTFSILKPMLWDMDGLKEGLQSLQAKELIFEKNLFPELEYGFTNTLIQEVAYRCILKENRADLHHHAGHAIETVFADSLAESYGLLAYHFNQSHDKTSALKYLRLAAVRAYSIYAHKEAIKKFEQAIELAERLGESEEALASRIDVRLEYGAQLIRLKGQTKRDFPEMMEEAKRLSHLLQDKEREASANIFISSYQILEGMFFEAEKHVLEIIAACKETGNQEQLATAHRLFHLCAFQKGDIESALHHGQKQLELQKKLGLKDRPFVISLDSYIHTCGSMAILVLLKGKREEAWEIFERGRKITEQGNDLALKAYNLADQGRLLMMEGYFEKGAKCVQESLNVLEKLGVTVALPALHMLNGIIISMTGEWTAGRKLIALGYRESIENQIVFHFIWYGILAAGTLDIANPGDPLVQEIKGKLAEMTAYMGTPYYKSMFQHLEGELLIRSNPVLAEKMLQESLKSFRKHRILYMVAHVLASLCECQKKLNKIQDAEANLLEAKEIYKRMGLPGIIEIFETKFINL